MSMATRLKARSLTINPDDGTLRNNSKAQQWRKDENLLSIVLLSDESRGTGLNCQEYIS